MLTLRHSRELYDWYAANGDDPRVIDAEEILNDRGAVRQFCIETGLDPEAVQYQWEPWTEAGHRVAAYKSTLIASRGIEADKAAARCDDIEAETVNWQAEFGPEKGEELARFVQNAMDDYAYLHSRRIVGRNDQDDSH